MSFYFGSLSRVRATWPKSFSIRNNYLDASSRPTEMTLLLTSQIDLYTSLDKYDVTFIILSVQVASQVTSCRVHECQGGSLWLKWNFDSSSTFDYILINYSIPCTNLMFIFLDIRKLFKKLWKWPGWGTLWVQILWTNCTCGRLSIFRVFYGNVKQIFENITKKLKWQEINLISRRISCRLLMTSIFVEFSKSKVVPEKNYFWSEAAWIRRKPVLPLILGECKVP